jgi:hypothetical protein
MKEKLFEGEYRHICALVSFRVSQSSQSGRHEQNLKTLVLVSLHFSLVNHGAEQIVRARAVIRANGGIL